MLQRAGGGGGGQPSGGGDDVVQAPNDKNQVEPMLEKIGALPEALGKVEHLLADTGYFSAGNVAAARRPASSLSSPWADSRITLR